MMSHITNDISIFNFQPTLNRIDNFPQYIYTTVRHECGTSAARATQRPQE